jgi:hypothetical protein
MHRIGKMGNSILGRHGREIMILLRKWKVNGIWKNILVWEWKGIILNRGIKIVGSSWCSREMGSWSTIGYNWSLKGS